MVSTTKTGVYPVGTSAALATIWFIPNVFSVSFQIYLDSAKLWAFMRMYLSLRVHWKPSSVAFIESNPASWTVIPAWEIPVRAPMTPGNPIVAWGIVSLTFQMKMNLFLFKPVLADQSRFLMVYNFPPLVLEPQAAIKEQWILHLCIKWVYILANLKRLFSTKFNKVGFVIFSPFSKKASSIPYMMSILKSPGYEEKTNVLWTINLNRLFLWTFSPASWIPFIS